LINWGHAGARPYRVEGVEFAFDQAKRGGNVQVIMWQLGKEFLLFLRQEKKWWLFPLVIVLLILGALMAFSGSSVLAPFMYPLY
jgi:hypothetical protein